MPTAPEQRYTTGVIGHVFVVRWRSFRLADVTAVRGEIAAARRTAGHRLVYLSLVPSSNRAFSAIEIVGLTDFVRDLLVRDCESIHHVIDGDGFIASARRSIVTSMALAATNPRAFRVHASLEEALGVIAADVGGSKDALLAEARARDLSFPASPEASS
jgi:hypothetical protein